MIPRLNYLTLTNDEYYIGILHRSQPMSYDNHRSTSPRLLKHALH
jgi:hypothetical protein